MEQLLAPQAKEAKASLAGGRDEARGLVELKSYIRAGGLEGSGSSTGKEIADVTGVRLSRAILAYVTAITAIITLAPFRFASAPLHGVTSIWTVSDIVMNVVMFMPLGFLYQLTRPRGQASPLWQVLILGAAVSAGIETAQLFEATRFSSLFDVTTNALGGLLGAVAHRLAVQRVEAARAVKSLALELPLMGLVYLLVPLAWLAGLASAGSQRAWFMLLVGLVAGSILGSIHAVYPPRRTRAPLVWLLASSAGWFAVALLPGGIRNPGIIIAGLTLTVGIAWLRSIATTRYRSVRQADGRDRRFELPTLRLALPFFAAYLALSSLWPLDAAIPEWYVGFALIPPAGADSREFLYRALEHVAAFTLVGYIVAEFHGRELRPYGGMIWRVIGWGGGVSMLLEATRGWHPDYGASVTMLLFTVAASVFGGWLYHLQRDHVLAVLASE